MKILSYINTDNSTIIELSNGKTMYIPNHECIEVEGKCVIKSKPNELREFMEAVLPKLEAAITALIDSMINKNAGNAAPEQEYTEKKDQEYIKIEKYISEKLSNGSSIQLKTRNIDDTITILFEYDVDFYTVEFVKGGKTWKQQEPKFYVILGILTGDLKEIL